MALPAQARGRQDGDVQSELSQSNTQPSSGKPNTTMAFLRLMDQVKAFRPTLFVTGGEPTLYWEFEGFVREAKQRRLFMHLATNGLSLEKHAAMLVEQGVEFVTVSLGGRRGVDRPEPPNRYGTGAGPHPADVSA